MCRKHKVISFILIICMYTTLNAGDYLRTPNINFKNKIQEIFTSKKIIFDSSLYAEICSLINQKLAEAEAEGTSLNKNREMITLKVDALTAILVILSDSYSDINLNNSPSINAALPMINTTTGMTNKQREAFTNDSKRVNLSLSRFRQAQVLSQTADKLGNNLICQIEKEYSQKEIQTVIIPLLQERFNIKYNLPPGAFLPNIIIKKLIDLPKNKEHE